MRALSPERFTGRAAACAFAGLVLWLGPPRLASAAEAGRGLRDATELQAGTRSMERWLAGVAALDPAYQPWKPRDAEAAPVGAAMRAVYDGLQYFLSDSLRAEFLGLSTDALRSEFARRYWILRDPTPTTPENERRDEHEIRVQYARAHFPMLRRPYWDDRGEFYIRFGAPSSMHNEPADVRLALGYVPRRETWIYRGTELVIAFEQAHPGLPYALGNSAVKQSNRRDVLRDAVPSVGDDWSPVHAYRFDADRVSILEVTPDARVPWLEGWAPAPGAILAAGVTRSAAERFTSASLPRRFVPAVFDCDAFRADSARTRVEVHLQFNLRDLQFAAMDSLWAAQVSVQGVLLDSELREAARDGYHEIIPVRSRATALGTTLWPAQLAFEVPPGLYRLALRVQDTRDGGAGDFAVDLRVPRFGAGRLVLSDLEMASGIETRPDMIESRFAKGPQIVMPNPSGAYARGAPVVAYFEIYGLHADARGERHYEVAYRIEPVTGKPRRWWPWRAGAQEPAAQSRVRVAGQDAEPAEALRIDVGTLDAGAYRLEVVLRDEQSGEEANAGTYFRILAAAR